MTRGEARWRRKHSGLGSVSVGALMLLLLASGNALYPYRASAQEATDLFSYARDYAQRQGFRFGAGSDIMLEQALGPATAELAQLPPAERAAKTREAQRNIERFVDEMIAASRRIPGYSERSPGVIGEQTMAEASGKLCPIWPICR